jgi:glucose 1-dehydrogenase
MRALTVTPGVAASARVTERPAREPHEELVLVRTLAVGVCGTDRDIAAGRLGSPPAGQTELVIGHEVLGRVESPAGSFERGQLVTSTVRRSCGGCRACTWEAYDACTGALPLERGIDALDGFASDFYEEDPRFLVRVPEHLGLVGVLAEPMSIAEKAVRQIYSVGGRQAWFPERALVLGAGTIGLLTAALLTDFDLDVSVVGRARAVAARDIVRALGARFVALEDSELERFALALRADIVVEATGDGGLVELAARASGPGGVVCLLGLGAKVPTESGTTVAALAERYVLHNRLLFGSVNAAPDDWRRALDRLEGMERRSPDILRRMLTGNFPLEAFADGLAHRGIKAVLTFD